MAPLADLADHSSVNHPAKHFYDSKNSEFVVIALEHIKSGEPITIDNGNHHLSNSHFWLKYGFIDDALSFKVTISLQLNEFCPLFSQKKQLLNQKQKPLEL